MASAQAIIPYDRKTAGKKSAETQPYYTRGGPSLLADTDASPEDKKPNPKQEKEWAALYQHYESRRQALYTWRLPFWTTWQQIARYERPDRSYSFIVENT